MKTNSLLSAYPLTVPTHPEGFGLSKLEHASVKILAGMLANEAVTKSIFHEEHFDVVIDASIELANRLLTKINKQQ